MKKGLTLSMIFVANSANYSEGFGNISTLKKLHRGMAMLIRIFPAKPCGIV